ncbi:MAG: hypothetical protein IJO52_01755, partial [Clostridia bacterium]|nr:hypothetical protein [Clostridia bacterium]
SDVYVWRASYLSVLNIDSQYVYNEDQNFDILRFDLNEWKRVNPFLLKDFYVLTPWHTENDNSDFTAYCFYDPQKEEGVMLAFRQEQCVREQLDICIPFADDESEYILSDEDTGECIYTDGKLTLTFAEPRSAKLIWIKKRG